MEIEPAPCEIEEGFCEGATRWQLRDLSALRKPRGRAVRCRVFFGLDECREPLFRLEVACIRIVSCDSDLEPRTPIGSRRSANTVGSSASRDQFVSFDRADSG